MPLKLRLVMLPLVLIMLMKLLRTWLKLLNHLELPLLRNTERGYRKFFMLSPGQERIREIIISKLPEYKNEGSDRYSDFTNRIIDLFDEDPIIRNDHVTSDLLGFNKVSPNYFLWCQIFSNKASRGFNIRSLERYVYWRSQGNYMPPIQTVQRYKGGRKSNSTIHHLFCLAENKPFSVSIDYYHPSGILTVTSDGNHRLLAYVLWGDLGLIKPYITVYEEIRPDESLFEALLEIDHLFQNPRFDQSFFRFHGSREDFLLQADLVKEFVKALDEEKYILQKYVKYFFSSENERLFSLIQENRRSIIPKGKEEFNINRVDPALRSFHWVYSHLLELRSIKKASSNSFFHFFRKKPALTPYKDWYFENRKSI